MEVNMSSWLKQARTVSNVTVEECASRLDLSEEEYLWLEKHPGFINLVQINALLYLFNYEAKQIVWFALQDIDICKFAKHE